MPTKYFTGQEVPIKLNPGIGVLGGTITVPKILYWKPDGTKGNWTATVSGEEIIYTTNNSELVVGDWTFQVSYLNSGKQQYGQKVYETVGNKLYP